MAAALLVGGFAAALILPRQDAVIAATQRLSGSVSRGTLGLFWVIYFCGAWGGLLAMAHAAGLMSAAGVMGEGAQMAPAAIATANMAGCFLGGVLMDRIAVKRVLMAILALTLASMASLIGAAGWWALAPLLLAGAAYGALITAIPVAVKQVIGNGHEAAFARVFTACGAAGLVSPALAGYLFDLSASYVPALAAATVIASLGALFAWRLSSRPADAG